MVPSIALAGKLVRLSGAVAGATTDVTTAAVDTQGYQGVAFVGILGDVVTGCVLSAKAQGGSASDGSDAVDISGAATGSFTADGTSADNKFVVLEVVKMSGSQRWVRAVFSRGTANAPFESIFAVLLGPNKLPISQPNAVLAVQKAPQG